MIDKSKLFSTAVAQETAVLVAVSTQKQTAEKTKEYLEELAFSGRNAGCENASKLLPKIWKELI